MSLDFESLTSSAVIRPGDTLVVGMADADQTEEDLDRLGADLKDKLPGVQVAVILGATSMATYRPADFADLETKAAAG